MSQEDNLLTLTIEGKAYACRRASAWQQRLA